MAPTTKKKIRPNDLNRLDEYPNSDAEELLETAFLIPRTLSTIQSTGMILKFARSMTIENI